MSIKKISPLILVFLLFFVSAFSTDDSDTKVLLHGNSVPIVDESGKLWSSNNATVSTSQYKFGGGSLSFNGSSEINTADSSDFYFGDGRPVTFDWWMKLNALPANQNKISIINQGTDVSHFWNVEIFNNGGAYALVFETANGGINVSARYLTSLTANTWHHYVVQKDGSSYSYYQDCVRLTNGYDNSLQFPNFSTSVRIGRFLNTGHGVNGYIDEFRLSRVARYSGNTCTLPISEYGSSGPSNPTQTLTPVSTNAPTHTPAPEFTYFNCTVGNVAYELISPSEMRLWCE